MIWTSEVAHADDALAGFAHDGEGLGHEGVEGGFFGGVKLVRFSLGVDALDGFGDAGAELDGFVAELLVGEGFDGRLERIDFIDDGDEAFDGAVVGRCRKPWR